MLFHSPTSMMLPLEFRNFIPRFNGCNYVSMLGLMRLKLFHINKIKGATVDKYTSVRVVVDHCIGSRI